MTQEPMMYHPLQMRRLADIRETLLSVQGPHCAICEAALDETKPPVVDHDHGTGQVRGLLCLSCNSRIGKVEGGTRTPLMAEFDYLQKYGGVPNERMLPHCAVCGRRVYHPEPANAPDHAWCPKAGCGGKHQPVSYKPVATQVDMEAYVPAELLREFDETADREYEARGRALLTAMEMYIEICREAKEESK